VHFDWFGGFFAHADIDEFYKYGESDGEVEVSFRNLSDGISEDAEF